MDDNKFEPRRLRGFCITKFSRVFTLLFRALLFVVRQLEVDALDEHGNAGNSILSRMT